MPEYVQSDQEIIAIGGLKFVIMNRRFGDDGGASIEVFGEVEGKSLQVLRFDCFEKAPHYHYDPAGKNINESMEMFGIEQSVGWAMEQIRHNIPQMLRTAGYVDLAELVDARALSTDWEQVKSAVDVTMQGG